VAEKAGEEVVAKVVGKRISLRTHKKTVPCEKHGTVIPELWKIFFSFGANLL
jgi:hypothetical protein